jgi:ribosomal protein S18 acetylase RimI-like enzyme
VVDFHPVEANLRDSFRVLASHRPTGEVREYPGVTIASAGVTFQMFNAAFLSTPVASENELERRVVQAATHFNTRSLDWACWVCESWLDGSLRRRARHVFRNLHLHLSVELPGMIAEELLPPEHPLPSMEMRRVRGKGTRDDFCAVGSVCFNVPLDWFREVFQGREVWDEFAAWVGYVEEEPVTTAATVTGSGVVGIYNVATLPGHQRRGYGEAVLRYALDRAREEHGVTRSILQSTAQGFQLYQRMGYRTVTRVAVYSS